jgi:hypothetical protein
MAACGVFMTRECHVVSWFILQGLKLARVTTKPLDMGATCLLQSFSSNSIFIILYLYHEIEVDYLVVDKMFNISILIDYNCMFSIGANL